MDIESGIWNTWGLIIVIIHAYIIIYIIFSKKFIKKLLLKLDKLSSLLALDEIEWNWIVWVIKKSKVNLDRSFQEQFPEITWHLVVPC